MITEERIFDRNLLHRIPGFAKAVPLRQRKEARNEKKKKKMSLKRKYRPLSVFAKVK